MSPKIIITNIYSKLSGFDIEIMYEIDKITSYKVEGHQFTKAYRVGWYDSKSGKFRHWDGKKHLLTRAGHIPTGLLKRVLNYLDFNNISYKIEDKRPNIKSNKELPTYLYDPRPYQISAVESAIQNGRGIIKMATGSGKTYVSAMITAKYNLPTIIYVVGKDLLYQFHKEFQKILKKPIGLIGDGNCEIEKINICSVWTASTAFDLKKNISMDDEDWTPEILDVSNEDKGRIKRLIQKTNLAIFDEAHFLATETIQSIYKASKNCRYIFGMSGSPWRDDGADLLIEAICGNKIIDISASQLIDEGFLVKPKIKVLDLPKYKGQKRDGYSSIYKNYIIENDFRNKLAINATIHLHSKDRKILILVRRIKHGKLILEKAKEAKLKAIFLNGKSDIEERNNIRKSLINDEINCIIATNIFDIGIDIPELDALILLAGGKSSVRTLQRIGRVIRTSKGKTDAIIVDFADDAPYLKDHALRRIAVYETEPLFVKKYSLDRAKVLDELDKFKKSQPNI